jgi:hypothetical protein
MQDAFATRRVRAGKSSTVAALGIWAVPRSHESQRMGLAGERALAPGGRGKGVVVGRQAGGRAIVSEEWATMESQLGPQGGGAGCWVVVNEDGRRRRRRRRRRARDHRPRVEHEAANQMGGRPLFETKKKNHVYGVQGRRARLHSCLAELESPCSSPRTQTCRQKDGGRACRAYDDFWIGGMIGGDGQPQSGRLVSH